MNAAHNQVGSNILIVVWRPAVYLHSLLTDRCVGCSVPVVFLVLCALRKGVEWAFCLHRVPF